jgi:hypothetical protein
MHHSDSFVPMCTVTGAAVSGRLRRGRVSRSRSVLPDPPGTTGCSGCHRRRLDTTPSGPIRHAGHRPGRDLEEDDLVRHIEQRGPVESFDIEPAGRVEVGRRDRREVGLLLHETFRVGCPISSSGPRAGPGSPADRVHRRPFEFGSVDGAVSGCERVFLGAGNVRKSCYNALRCGSEPGRVARSRFTPRIRCRGCTAGAERSVR